MLQWLSSGAFVPWTPSGRGASLCPEEFKMPEIPFPRSCFSRLKVHFQPFQVGFMSSNFISSVRPQIYCCSYGRPNRHRDSKRHETLPQNVDLPPILPRKKKKPYPIPLKKIQQSARADKKLAQMGIKKPLEPPRNGILVPNLIPVAYEVLDAWKILIKGLAHLLHVVPVHALNVRKFM